MPRKKPPTIDPKKIGGPPYDPALHGALSFLDASVMKDLESIRKMSNCFSVETVLVSHPDLTHREYSVPPLRGGPIPISVFKKKSTMATGYFEGIDVVTFAVEYRLAPEHPAPAALNDSYMALNWIMDNAAEFGIDPERVILVGGSGGASIVAGLTMEARAYGRPKRILGQMLLAPMLDDRGQTVSAQQFEGVGPWCGGINNMAWDCVLGENRAGGKVSERVAPARSTDLTGLPPAFIDAGESEVFRDEAVAYASMLWKCGVSAELHIWRGGFHGFDICVPVGPRAPVAVASVDAKKSWIRRVLTTYSNAEGLN